MVTDWPVRNAPAGRLRAPAGLCLETQYFLDSPTAKVLFGGATTR